MLLIGKGFKVLNRQFPLYLSVYIIHVQLCKENYHIVTYL